MDNMLKNDFKLNLYFEMYKDSSVINMKEFIKRFNDKHGKFECIFELIFMIEEYQREKYGNLIDYYCDFAPGKKGKKER